MKTSLCRINSAHTHWPHARTVRQHALNQTLQAGDAYILRSSGGGGYGSPHERDVTALERDVRCGYVSRESTVSQYGVVFHNDTTAVDTAATLVRRTPMRGQGLPHDQPIAETLAPLAPAPNTNTTPRSKS